MERRKAYVFDIDGTLAHNGHRQHYVKKKPKNWNAYQKLSHLDSPIIPTISTLETLSLIYSIVICSGRQEKERKITEDWFKKHNIKFTKMLMRKTDDFRDDTIVKFEMLKEIEKEYEVIAVFDDRPKVCRMWVENGIFVFRCQQIEEEF